MFKQDYYIIRLFLILLLVGSLTACQKKEAQPLTAQIGQPAPTFALEDLSGRTWNLAELRGKVVFVNFWATWCQPCVEELPAMETLQQGMAAASFQMLAILNNDDPRLAANLARKMGLTFPVLLDPDGKVAKSYGITGVPETFIIDPAGILRHKYLGPRPWDSPEAIELLKRYLP